MVRGLRRIGFGLAAACASLFLSLQGIAAAPSPADISAAREEIQKIYDWAGYQRDLPDDLPPDEPVHEISSVSLDASPLLNVVLIGLVVVLAVMMAIWLRSGGLSALRWPVQDAGEASQPATTQRRQLETRLGEADRSATQGDWAEAIHILLLTSIDLLRRRVGQDVPVAMTARELIGRAQLADAARADFAVLVGAAELCHFGGRPAGRTLYDHCRTHYERLWGMSPEATA
jgi:hypothetical protein